MVGCPERAPRGQTRRRLAQGRLDARDLEGLLSRERGQDRREAAGQHRLPDTRWPDEHEVVTAGGGRGQRGASPGQPADVGQVERLVVEQALGIGCGWGREVGPRRLSLQARPQRGEIADGAHRDARHEGRLTGVGLGDGDGPGARRSERGDEGQGAGYRAHGAVEAQLAEHPHTVEATRRQLVAGEEDGSGEGQVEPRARLADGRRRQVDGDPLLGPRQLRGEDGGPDAVACLAHGGVGEADDGEAGKAAADVDLHADGVTLDPDEGGGADDGERHGGPP